MKEELENDDFVFENFLKKEIIPPKPLRMGRETIGLYMFYDQMETIGKTPMDVFDNDRWRFDFTITREQYNDFHKRSTKLLAKIFKVRREKVENIFQWYWMMFGVRIKN